MHNRFFTTATTKLHDTGFKRTVAGTRIAGSLLLTPMDLNNPPPLPAMWEDPICGLTDTLDHLDDKTLNMATLTRTLTTCFIEMWANNIVYPGTHTTHDQITDIATTILLDSKIWNDLPLNIAHNGTVTNPWLIYLTTHVVMMATAYGTRAVPTHLLLFRWQNKITTTLQQWAEQIDNTYNTNNNLEIFSEMVCCILWLDATPIPRFYQIAQELEESGLRS